VTEARFVAIIEDPPISKNPVKRFFLCSQAELEHIQQIYKEAIVRKATVEEESTLGMDWEV
jgi:hypothetical protein